jgi:hypothetical protein
MRRTGRQESDLWGEERKRQLRELHADPALSYEEIAQRIGVNKNQLSGKARRMGLPPRPSPIIRPGVNTPTCPPPPPQLAGRYTLPPLAVLLMEPPDLSAAIDRARRESEAR